MANRGVWRHPRDGTRFVVEITPAGEILAAAGPIAFEDPHIALMVAHTPDPNALTFVRSALHELVEEFELDEDGRLWNYRDEQAPTGAAVARH